MSLFLPLPLFSRLFGHFDEDLSRLLGAAYFAEERDSRSTYPLGRFQAQVKAEPVDAGHRRLLGFDFAELASQQDQRVHMIRIHNGR